jgi:hypothetical protein
MELQTLPVDSHFLPIQSLHDSGSPHDLGPKLLLILILFSEPPRRNLARTIITIPRAPIHAVGTTSQPFDDPVPPACAEKEIFSPIVYYALSIVVEALVNLGLVTACLRVAYQYIYV